MSLDPDRGTSVRSPWPFCALISISATTTRRRHVGYFARSRSGSVTGLPSRSPVDFIALDFETANETRGSLRWFSRPCRGRLQDHDRGSSGSAQPPLLIGAVVVGH